MKQFKPSVLLAFTLCVLIGYFEPANAQSDLSSASSMSSAAGSPTATMFISPQSGRSHFWPNPVGQGSTVSVIAADIPSGGYLIDVLMGGQYPVSVISAGQPLPASVTETNQWFEPIVDPAASSADASSPSAVAATDPSTASAASDSISSDSSSATASTSSSLATLAAGGSPAASVTETNQWFEPIITVSSLSLPVVSDGTYVLVIVGQNGNTYSTQVNISGSK